MTEAGGNTLQKITQGASVMGLFVMGALVYRWTSVNIPLPLTSYKNQAGAMVDVTVQSVLNDLLPGLASLGLCFLCMWAAEEEGQRYLVDFRPVCRGYPRFLPGLPGSLRIRG